MDLDKVKLIRKIADKGSITAAASELYISSVAAREQLLLIERDLGFALFTRTRRGASLTPEGEYFLNKAELLLEQFEATVGECRSMARPKMQPLCIALYKPYNFLSYCNTYGKFHPEVSFSFKEADYSITLRPAEYMKKNRIDIMQETYNPIYEETGLHFLPLQKDICCVYCDPSHPLGSRETISLDDLRGYTVYSEEAISYERIVIENNLHRAGVQTVSTRYDAMEMFNICAHGGVFLLEAAMQESFRQLRCIPLAPEQPVVHGIIYSAKPSPAVAAFLDYIREKIGDEQIQCLETLCKKMRESGDVNSDSL